jgi:hypothetical protein
MRGSICTALVVIVSLALPGLSQTGGVQAVSNVAAPQKRQPQHYTAELKDTSVKTLPDGTTITLETNTVMAVDSQGRSMNSTAELWELVDGKPTTYYSASDPVAGTHTSWTTPGTKATVITSHTHQTGKSDCTVFFSTPAGFTTNAPAGSDATEPGKSVVGKIASMSMKSSSVSNPQFDYLKSLHYNSTSEDLGTTTIQGVGAHGHRFTWTTPAGAMGNDQPMVHTQETWITTGDNPRALNVRQVADDPQSGKSTLELVNLSLEEPDLSVFQPPEGYEIVTQEMHSAQCPEAHKTPAQ